MTLNVVLIQLTSLAGLLVAAYGLVLYLRDRPVGGADGESGSQCETVQRSPRGRLLGVPNTALGIGYYLAVMVAFALPESVLTPIARGAAGLASLAAAAMSVFLLWSLMAITRRPCRVCLAGNAINLFLAGLIVAALAAEG